MSKVQFKESYVLALINSKLIAWLYTNTSAISVKDDFPQVTYEELKSLPIPRIAFTTSAEELEQLAAQAQMLYQGDEFEALRAFSQARLDLEPAQSDVVHDLLAYLAGQMIEMNREKQRITEDFWLDLEGALGEDEATFRKLRDKGKWESTLWKKKAARPYVAEESRSSRTLDEALAWDEAAYKGFIAALAGKVSHLADLVRVYRQYAPDYQRLTDRLVVTDALIDQIVFQLYGLDETEIGHIQG